MSQKLAGKVAIVTEVSKGIGAAIPRHLAAAGGTAIASHANVAEPHDVERLFAASVHAFGPIDILVNTAGAFDMALQMTHGW